jgi:hypothetical protein
MDDLFAKRDELRSVLNDVDGELTRTVNEFKQLSSRADFGGSDRRTDAAGPAPSTSSSDNAPLRSSNGAPSEKPSPSGAKVRPNSPTQKLGAGGAENSTAGKGSPESEYLRKTTHEIEERLVKLIREIKHQKSQAARVGERRKVLKTVYEALHSKSSPRGDDQARAATEVVSPEIAEFLGRKFREAEAEDAMLARTVEEQAQALQAMNGDFRRLWDVYVALWSGVEPAREHLESALRNASRPVEVELGHDPNKVGTAFLSTIQEVYEPDSDVKELQSLIGGPTRANR